MSEVRGGWESPELSRVRFQCGQAVPVRGRPQDQWLLNSNRVVSIHRKVSGARVETRAMTS